MKENEFKYYKKINQPKWIRVQLPFIENLARYSYLDHRDIGGACISGTTISLDELTKNYREITEDQFYRTK